MALDPVENFIEIEASSSIASGDTTIDVVDATNAPDPSTSRGAYNLVLFDADIYASALAAATNDDVEIVRVSGRDTGADTLTIARGQESTSAQGFASSAVLRQPATKRMIDDIHSQIEAYGDPSGPTLSAPYNGPSVSTDEVSISQFSTGYDYIIFRDSNYIYVADRTGEVVHGGPDSLNVSDATDFAEIFTTVVNNHTNIPSIRLSGGQWVDSFATTYPIKTSGHTLNKVFQLHGPGKNSANIGSKSGVAGNTIWTIDATANSDILRFDSLKFNAIDRNNQVGMYFDMDTANSPNEVISTHTEWRDAQDWAFKSSGSVGWNFITNSWFLEGAGFKIDDTRDVTLVGNQIRTSGTTCEVSNVTNKAVEMGTNYSLNAPKISYSSVSNLYRAGEDLETETATINQVAAKVLYGGSDHTFTAADTTQVQWDTLDFADTDVFSVDLSSNAITVDVAGTYQIGGFVGFNSFSSLDNSLQLKVRVNGSNRQIVDGGGYINTNRTFAVPIYSGAIRLSANDTLTLAVQQNSPNSTDETRWTNLDRNYWSIARLG